MKPERFGREIYEAESYLHLEGYKHNYAVLYGYEPHAHEVSDMIAHSAGVALLAAMTDIECDGMEPDISSIVISVSPPVDGVHDVHAVVDAYPLEPVAENDCE